MPEPKKFLSEKLIPLLNESILPFDMNDINSIQLLSDLIGDARIVLMGEATHGTTEFYQARMSLSRYLIEKKGFQAIAVEGDWASVFPIHDYCQGRHPLANATQALSQFKRFPSWMWRNTEMVEFIKQLRLYNNGTQNRAEKVGFYGLDLYGLGESIEAIIDSLKRYDPELAKKAVERYACFDHMPFDAQRYAYLTDKSLKNSCLHEVTRQLLDTYRMVYGRLNLDNDLHEKERQFYVTQNARVISNAEHYYRSLFEPHHVTWNIRDQHMVDTLQNIISHIETLTNKPAKVIVWAHNSHVGNALATEMSERQEVNVGQLVRERFNTSVFSLGFSTAIGSVTAASNWGGDTKYLSINPPIHGGYERLFHQLKEKNFLLNLLEDTRLTHLLQVPQLQRAIGVIYRPDTERMSHYYFSRLAYQFDAMIHFDQTHALTPLKHHTTHRKDTELPETYPSGS